MAPLATHLHRVGVANPLVHGRPHRVVQVALVHHKADQARDDLRGHDAGEHAAAEREEVADAVPVGARVEDHGTAAAGGAGASAAAEGGVGGLSHQGVCGPGAAGWLGSRFAWRKHAMGERLV
eukprot:2385268-Prymnesium_polylepis.1